MKQQTFWEEKQRMNIIISNSGDQPICKQITVNWRYLQLLFCGIWKQGLYFPSSAIWLREFTSQHNPSTKRAYWKFRRRKREPVLSNPFRERHCHGKNKGTDGRKNSLEDWKCLPAEAVDMAEDCRWHFHTKRLRNVLAAMCDEEVMVLGSQISAKRIQREVKQDTSQWANGYRLTKMNMEKRENNIHKSEALTKHYSDFRPQDLNLELAIQLHYRGLMGEM